jgi:hypothetical protein
VGKGCGFFSHKDTLFKNVGRVMQARDLFLIKKGKQIADRFKESLSKTEARINGLLSYSSFTENC